MSRHQVIGINDYIFIDGYKKVLDAKRRGRLANIDLILPVIELRLDKFGGSDGHLSRINFHIIFSDIIEPEIIQQQFLNALPRKYQLTPAYDFLKHEWNAIATRESLVDLGKLIRESVPQEKRGNISDALLGFNNINFRLEDVFGSLDSHYFTDRYFTAVGKTEWANIRWKEQSIADKKNIINTSGFVFMSAKTIKDCLNAKKALTDSLVNNRLLDCSDAHYFSDSGEKERIGKCYTWIKADPTFEGLKQVYNEPDERIFIGDIPDKTQAVAANKTKYIKSLSIRKRSESSLDEVWFDTELDFNHGLIAIVGNKGTGKSALSDIIGLLGNTKNHSSFSFLNTKRFRQPSNNKSTHFEATLAWESNTTETKQLDGRIGAAEVEMVKYIPQNFFELRCNEIPGSEESDFDREIKKVIFSHVEDRDRLGKSSMDELIGYKTRETYDAINILKAELQEINKQIVTLENRGSSQYRVSIEKQLQVKKEELKSHEEAKPKVVRKPSIDSQQQQTASISALESSKKELQGEIADTKKLQKNIAILISASDKALAMIDNFNQRYESFKEECLVELDQLGIPFESITTLTLNKEPLLAKRSQLFDEKRNFDWLLNKENTEGSAYNLSLIERQVNDFKSKLDELSKSYYAYQSALETWTQRKLEIIGDESTLDSLQYFERVLKGLDIIPVELKVAKIRRRDLTGQIYAKIRQLAQTYRELYKPVEEFIQNHQTAKAKLSLDFDVSIINVEFQTRFFDWISHAIAGSFCGVTQGRAMLNSIIERYDFNNETSVLKFLDEVIEHLTEDKRLPICSPVRISDQLKRGQSILSLYDFIFSLDYLQPRYVLKMGGKELHQLSPGEKGAVLLVFYLLVDKDDIPLIIDQPEENLDNQTVYDLLVPFIKEVKRRRQIFIITHNPNLAVVCDAEQIICASHHKTDKNRVEYISGAIENPIINRQILDILEGTRPAFNNRSSKYLTEKA